MNPKSTRNKSNRKSDQDQRIANRLGAINQILLLFMNDLSAMQRLKEHGYPDLSEGFLLQDQAMGTFTARQIAMAAQGEATTAVIEAQRAVRVAYGDFRKIGRVVFKDDITRAALGLTGRIPVERARLIHLARTGFETAQKPDYAPALARRGLTAAVFEANLALLAALVAADEAQVAAMAAARQATANRTTAMARLDAWFGEFRGIAKVAFRQQPEWVSALKIR